MTMAVFYIVVFASIIIVIWESSVNSNVDLHTAREAGHFTPVIGVAIIGAALLFANFAYFRWRDARSPAPKKTGHTGRLSRVVQGLIRFSRRPWPAASMALFGVYSVLATLAHGLSVLLAR